MRYLWEHYLTIVYAMVLIKCVFLIKSFRLNFEYRTGVAPRTLWHHVGVRNMGFGVSKIFIAFYNSPSGCLWDATVVHFT